VWNRSFHDRSLRAPNRSRIASAFASDTGYTVDDYSCAEN